MTTAYNMVELESTVELCDNSFDRENQIFDHRLSVLHRNVFGKHIARLMLSAKITCRGLRVEHGGFHLFRRFVGLVWMAITRDSDPVVELFVCFSASFKEVPWCWPEIWWSSLDISVIRRICETKWKKRGAGGGGLNNIPDCSHAWRSCVDFMLNFRPQDACNQRFNVSGLLQM